MRHRHPKGAALPQLGAGAAYELALLPAGIRGTTTVTSWRDVSGRGNHATPGGAPVRGRSGGLAGVTLDGVDDYLGGSLVLAADRPLTVFTVSQWVSQSTAVRVVFECSDTGATGRGLQVVQENGYREVRPAQIGATAAAFYAYADETLRVHTFEARQNDRLVRQDGRWKGSACNDAGTSRASTAYRIGAALGTPASFLAGLVCAVVVVSGSPSETEVQQIEDFLERLARKPIPTRYPGGGLYSDLHQTLPSTIDTIVGERTSIWIARPTTINAGAVPVDFTDADRITLAPTVAGDTSITITEEGQTPRVVTLHAVAPLGGSPPLRKVLFVGDSNGARMAAGALEVLLAELGASSVLFVGTQGPASGYSCKHEGRDSWGWNTFNNRDPLQPGTLAASPFYVDDDLDIDAYIASLAGPPDDIIWAVGGNDVYGESLVTVDDRVAELLDEDAEPLLAAWSAAAPDVRHIITSPWVTCSDIAVHQNSAASMAQLRAVNARCVELFEEAFAGREAERIYHRPTFARLDPLRGYVDAFHMAQNQRGAISVVRALKASLVALWPALVARITAAVVDGNVSASKLTLTFSSAAHFPDLTGISLDFEAGTPRTISSIDSGNDSTSVVLNLSGAVLGTDVFAVVVGATRTQTTVSGGEPIQTGSINVSIQNLSNPFLTSPGTDVGWWGADSVTLTGSNIDSYVDKSTAGNNVTFAGTTKAVQGTTVGGNKKATHVNNTWYQKSALAVSLPASHSGTIYLAAKISNWNPSGGYAAFINIGPDAVEGSGHYDRGIYFTPSANAYWKGGYNTDGNISYVLNPAPNANVNVWAFTYAHGGVCKIYKNGTLEFTSGTLSGNPAAGVGLRIGTLWYPSHTSTEMDLYQLAMKASADSSAVHDASTVATVSTYLATLTT